MPPYRITGRIDIAMGFDIKLELRPELRLEQRHKLRLEQRLMLYVPTEFQPHINIEMDEDIELLRKSIAFLSLHEFSHPLYSRGKVQIPLPTPLPAQYGHNAIETGIDKAAMLLGDKNGISTENMINSHLAMMERAVRDYLISKKYQPEMTLFARFYAEIQEHHAHAQNDIQKKKLEVLLGLVQQNLPGEKSAFQDQVEQYAPIYRGTTLTF